MKISLMRRILGASALLLLTGVALGAADPPAAPETPDSIRTLLAKWAETQQILSKEREEWKQSREVLLSRIELVKGEIAAFEGKTSETSKAGQDTRQEKQKLLAEGETLKTGTGSLLLVAGELEARIRALQPRLPDPLKEKIAPLTSRMPADSAHSAASSAERFQNIAGILNEINKFNGEITVTSEIRSLSDGKPAEVRVVYVGLGQAYFVGSRGQAGIGRPSSGGWEWKTDDSIAPQVQEVVEVLQSKAKPKFIPLPVELR
ncbi:MAG TPA: DUF3450 family protein [Candidatus Polarisedimenticolia bacterium]|nr:DUF3450 family protein [Candidatus Polarisedimenticolia bacterium]